MVYAFDGISFPGVLTHCRFRVESGRMRSFALWPTLLACAAAPHCRVFAAHTHKSDLRHLGLEAEAPVADAFAREFERRALELQTRHRRLLAEADRLGHVDLHALLGAAAPSRVKRGGENYVALPLPALPDDVRANLDQMQMLSGVDSGLVKLAAAADADQFDLTPDLTLNPSSHSTFGGKPNYPNSIQDVMEIVGVLNPTQNQRRVDGPQSFEGHTAAPIYYPPTKTPRPKYRVPATEKPAAVPIYYPPTKTSRPKHRAPAPRKPPSSSYNPPSEQYESPAPSTYAPAPHADVEYHTRPDPPYPSSTYAPAPHADVEYHTRPDPAYPATYAPPAKTRKKQQDYMAVIPYRDVHKLFEMMNKYVAPAPHPKPRTYKTTTEAPKKKRKLQPKVVKVTEFDTGHKKKKKKVTKVVEVRSKSIYLLAIFCTCEFFLDLRQQRHRNLLIFGISSPSEQSHD
jgi:hypothetical protein